MTMKKRGARRKVKKRGKKIKPAKTLKTSRTPKMAEPKKPLSVPAKIVVQASRVEPPSGERFRMTVGNIRGDTSIGDLLVTFPRTREVLVRNGLRLESDGAGDIYMTLDAFSAMNGLKTVGLVLEIVEAAKEPLPQSPPAQLVTPPPS